jgi:hypothetical protein
MTERLTNEQLAWLVNRSPGFARSYADVLRRDADVEMNRLQMTGCTATRSTNTALSNPATVVSLPAERSQRHDRSGTQS